MQDSKATLSATVILGAAPRFKLEELISNLSKSITVKNIDYKK